MHECNNTATLLLHISVQLLSTCLNMTEGKIRNEHHTYIYVHIRTYTYIYVHMYAYYSGIYAFKYIQTHMHI